MSISKTNLSSPRTVTIEKVKKEKTEQDKKVTQLSLASIRSQPVEVIKKPNQPLQPQTPPKQLLKALDNDPLSLSPSAQTMPSIRKKA